MGKEHIKILTMLSEGKITSSEALKLLEALDHSSGEGMSPNGMDLNENLLKSIEKSFIGLSQNTESISAELLNKVENIGKAIESKLNIDSESLNESLKAFNNELKNIMNKISGDMDGSFGKVSVDALNINKNMGELDKINEYIENLKTYLTGISIDIPGLNDKLYGIIGNIDISRGTYNNFRRTYSKTISEASDLKLNLESSNGSIIVEGYDEDEVLIDVNCRTPEKDIRKIITLIDKPGSYGLKAKALSGTFVTFYVQIPKKEFQRIYISTFNDKIQVSDISCKALICKAPMGRISLSGVCCDIIDCSTSKSKIELSDIVCKKLFVETSDSPVTAENINSGMCRIKTSNNRIYLTFSDEFAGTNNTVLITDNGKIQADLHPRHDTGVFIECSTTDGNINIDIPNVSYKTNEQSIPGNSHVVCQTENFDSAKNTIKIKASTTNSWISIK